MATPLLRIGIVGTGGMANAHAGAFRRMKRVVLTACCDRDKKRAEEFAARHEIPRVFTAVEDLLEAELVDAISNVTPDAVHAEIAVKAAKAGVHILSEKPLATSVEEGEAMVRAVRKAGVVNMVNFSYRDSSAIQECARRVAAGDIGRVMHVESSYLQCWLSSTVWGDWRTRPGWLWRLSTAHGSLGALGDIGCHLYDATALLAGDIEQIVCRLKTFDKGVRGNRLGAYRLDANDSFASTVVFRGGGLGSVHSSRWATGQKNSLSFKIYGDEGAFRINLDEAWDQYDVCAGKKDVATATFQRKKARPTRRNYERFVRAIRSGVADPSDFANGLKVQRYLAASVESSETGRWVKLRASAASAGRS